MMLICRTRFSVLIFILFCSRSPLYASTADFYVQMVNRIVTYKVNHFDVNLSFDLDKSLIFVECSMTVVPLKDKMNKFSLILPLSVNKVSDTSLNGAPAAHAMQNVSVIKMLNISSTEPVMKGSIYTIKVNYSMDAVQYPGTIDKDYIELGMEIAYWLPFLVDQTFTHTVKAAVPKEFYAQISAKTDYTLEGSNKIYRGSSLMPSPNFPRFYASTIKPFIKKKNGLHVQVHSPDDYKEYLDFIAHSIFEIINLYKNTFHIAYDPEFTVFIRKPKEGQVEYSSFGGRFIVALSGSSIESYRLLNNKKDTENYLFYLLSHELGHSIFPGTVGASVLLPGNAFLIEGFAEFCFLYAAENHYKSGESLMQFISKEYIRYIQKLKSLGDAAMPLDKASTRDEEPKRISYTKGALVLRMLRYIMGDENFFPAMQAYVSQYSRKIASISDFENIMQQHSQSSLQWFFDDYFSSLKDLDFSLSNISVDEKNNGVSFTLENLGSARFESSIEIMIRTSREKKVFEVSPFHQRELRFSIRGKLLSLEIDPNWRILDIDRYNNVYPKRGWLGIEVGTVDEDVKKKTGYKEEGVYVKNIMADSEAERVPLMPLDILLKVDGKKPNDVYQLERIFITKEVKDIITLTILREGKIVEMRTRCGEKPQGDKHLLGTY